MELPDGISIRPIQTEQDAARAAEFMSLHFGTYDPESKLRWITEKCLPRLLRRTALGLLVYYDDLFVVGDSLMYAFPDENMGEVKHFYLNYLSRGQGIGKILWEQSETAMVDALSLAPGQTATLTLDTRESNVEARRFFLARGCHEVGQAALYEHDIIDVQYQKTIQAPRIML